MYRDTEGTLRWEGKFRTKSNAQTRLSEVLNEIDKGTYSRPSSLSFEQFAKEWLLSRRQLRGSTEAGYSSLIDKQLIPRLGSMKVSRVRFEDIDAAVSGMIEDELASKTIHNAVMLLRNMLAGRKGPSAFRRGLAFADSTLGVKLPPLAYRQIVPPTPRETWALIKAAKEIGGVRLSRSRTWVLSAECDEVRLWVLGSSTFDGSIMKSAFNMPSRNGAARMAFASGSGTSARQNLASRCAVFRPPTA